MSLKFKILPIAYPWKYNALQEASKCLSIKSDNCVMFILELNDPSSRTQLTGPRNPKNRIRIKV
jgi:hypothetical protein